jgi:hypothetical protein
MSHSPGYAGRVGADGRRESSPSLARRSLMLVAMAGALALSAGQAVAAGATYVPNRTGDHTPDGWP